MALDPQKIQQFVQQARSQGYSDDEINSEIANQTKSREIPPNPTEANKNFSLTSADPNQKFHLQDLLPLALSIGGGALGSPLGPLGVIAGSAAGGALGSFGKQAITNLSNPQSNQGINTGDIGKEALIGGASAGAGEVLGGALRLGGKLVGGKLAQAGENLATKAVRPSPSQAVKFNKITGKTIGKFLQEENLVGAGAQEIKQATEPLQQSFDSMVRNENVTIPSNEVYQAFSKKIATLSDSTVPQDKAKAAALEQILTNFKTKFLHNDIPAAALTGERIAFDKTVSEFASDPAMRGTSQSARDILNNLIFKAVDKTGLTAEGGVGPRELGMQLRNYYKAADIAEKQSGLGKGSSLFGMKPLIASGAGAAVGGLPGAVAGGAIEMAAGHPAVVSTASKLATGAGEGIGNLSTLGSSPFAHNALNALMQTGGQGVNALAGNMQNGQPTPAPDLTNPDYGSSDSTNGLETPLAPVSSVHAPPTTPFDNKWLQQALLTDMASGGKNIDKIQTIYKLMNPSQSTKPKPVAGVQQENLAKSGIRNLNQIEQLYKADPSVVYKQTLPGKFASREFDSAAYRTIESLLRARSGAAVPETEVRRYMASYIPRIGDDPKTVSEKFKDLRSTFSDILQGSSETAGSIDPASQQLLDSGSQSYGQ